MSPTPTDPRAEMVERANAWLAKRDDEREVGLPTRRTSMEREHLLCDFALPIIVPLEEKIRTLTAALASARESALEEAATAHNCAIGEAYNATFDAEDTADLRKRLLRMLRGPSAPAGEQPFGTAEELPAPAPAQPSDAETLERAGTILRRMSGPGGLWSITETNVRALAAQLRAAPPAAPTRPMCPGCGNEIDPDWCHCGIARANHGFGDGHSFVPMGCDCMREKPESAPTPAAEDVPE